MKTKHTHNYVFDRMDRYRDEEGNEFMAQVYKCECGAGKRDLTPIVVVK